MWISFLPGVPDHFQYTIRWFGIHLTYETIRFSLFPTEQIFKHRIRPVILLPGLTTFYFLLLMKILHTNICMNFHSHAFPSPAVLHTHTQTYPKPHCWHKSCVAKPDLIYTDLCKISFVHYHDRNYVAHRRSRI